MGLALHQTEARQPVDDVGDVGRFARASWLRTDEAAQAAVAARSPLNRLGVPDDVAGIVAFLVSADAGWVTGQTIDATGGALL
ncbi:SDR family oxidoreductase [Catenulispora pinisilvae]|uniref:SDR family oxidoreductase n=1 Tax=Catenulispora pinisilvae TaxID=2705253 RepID=UPI002B268DE5|nr:SDR family oxidoreductase [Catenulispora pinisilvae]